MDATDHPPTTCPAPPRPSLARLAAVLHEAAPRPSPALQTATTLCSVTFTDASDEGGPGFDLGLWPVPGHLHHPLAPVVGFRAPRTWDAVGVISAAWTRPPGEPSGERRAAEVVSLWDRAGACASAVGPAGEAPTILLDAPEGLVPDVIRRMLGLPTPPPPFSPAAAVDVTWLEAVAAAMDAHPRARRTWPWLAREHPHHGHGPTPEPAMLALRARVTEAATWRQLRGRLGHVALPAARWGPEGGEVLGAGEWFDDGSLCRWLTGTHSDPARLLDHVLASLEAPERAKVLAALADLRPERAAS